MAKFIPDYLKGIVVNDIEVEEEADMTEYIDLTEETHHEKKCLIRDMLGRFDYTLDEIELFVNDINLDLRIGNIEYALRKFTRGERNINTECKYLFPIYRSPLRIEKKKELVKYMLIGGIYDDYIVNLIIKGIDFEIDMKIIRDNIFSYLRTRRTRRDEQKYLFTIFKSNKTDEWPTEDEWKLSMDTAAIREAKTSVVIPPKRRGIKSEYSKKWDAEEDKMDMAPVLQYPSYVKKTEEEVTRAMTPDIATAEFLKKRLEGDDVICVFCNEVILPTDPMSFWYNVYPAHMSCIHKQLDIIDAENQRR